MDYYGDSAAGGHPHHPGPYGWASSTPQYDAYGGPPQPPPPHYGIIPPDGPPTDGPPQAHQVTTDEPPPPEDQVTLLNPQEIQADCLAKFARPDYIMEPGIFNQLKRYFQSGGNPEQVIDLLSSNYCAFAQMANLMAEWIIGAGIKRKTYRII